MEGKVAEKARCAYTGTTSWTLRLVDVFLVVLMVMVLSTVLSSRPAQMSLILLLHPLTPTLLLLPLTPPLLLHSTLGSFLSHTVLLRRRRRRIMSRRRHSQCRRQSLRRRRR